MTVAQLSAESSKLVERGDLDELTVHVNRLVAGGRWAELEALRTRCRLALERGKQLWAVGAHIEYRLCLEAPGYWSALMLETATGRFALGPLPEVAASTHSWAELSPHLHATPQAAMAAHERVMRSDDLTGDPFATSLPEVLDLPLCLQGWEPRYPLADYQADKLQAPPPAVAALRPVAPAPAPRTPARGERDEACAALEDLAGTWATESNGRAEAVSVRGGAPDAVSALGAPLTQLAELSAGEALSLMAWAAASGGAYGRRRGAAPGRFGAWMAVAALGGRQGSWPLRAGDLEAALQDLRWYAWGSGEPPMGWALRLVVESTGGPHRGRAWALAALDAT
ncbi:MAG: DUF6183 family protein [Acidimicrobiales bacterium]